jgi:hypothetical protein
LASSIYANSQIQHRVAEKGVSDRPLFRITNKIDRCLDMIRLPNRIVSTLLRCAELLPLKAEKLTFITEQRHLMKTLNSIIGLPSFFIKQIQLYKACANLKRNFTLYPLRSWDKVVVDVKKTFFASLSALIAGLKFPLLLDETRIIDLTNISKTLPKSLAKGGALVSLAMSSMRIADTAWTLRNELKNDEVFLDGKNWSLSPKGQKTFLKLGSNSVQVLSNSMSVAALFLGLYTNPLILVAVSVVSLSFTLVGKVVHSKGAD